MLVSYFQRNLHLQIIQYWILHMPLACVHVISSGKVALADWCCRAFWRVDPMLWHHFFHASFHTSTSGSDASFRWCFSCVPLGASTYPIQSSQRLAEGRKRDANGGTWEMICSKIPSWAHGNREDERCRYFGSFQFDFSEKLGRLN